ALEALRLTVHGGHLEPQLAERGLGLLDPASGGPDVVARLEDLAAGLQPVDRQIELLQGERPFHSPQVRSRSGHGATGYRHRTRYGRARWLATGELSGAGGWWSEGLGPRVRTEPSFRPGGCTADIGHGGGRPEPRRPLRHHK